MDDYDAFCSDIYFHDYKFQRRDGMVDDVNFCRVVLGLFSYGRRVFNSTKTYEYAVSVVCCGGWNCESHELV